MKTLVLLLPLLLAFCKQKPVPTASVPVATLAMTTAKPGDAFQSDAFTLADFFSSSAKLDSIIEKRFAEMSTETKAAQLIFHATSEQRGAALPFEKTKNLFEKGLLSGVLFLKGDVNIFQRQLRLLDSIVRKKALTPAFFGCDCEPTLYHKSFWVLIRLRRLPI